MGAVEHARAARRSQVRALAALVRIPSVSADPARAADVRRCAGQLVRLLQTAGLERARLIETGGHPLVAAEWLRATGRPTLLVYGHYDVVPAEPLAAWRTPPFTPVVEGDYLHGRGACDDKGPLLCHVSALASWLAAHGRLPVNVRCVFEGEEEIGSPGLARVLARDAAAFRADVAVVSDTRMAGRGRPAIVYALRGNLRAELEVRGPRREVHSGAFGGAVANPADALCRIVASLHRRDGSVAVTGFYRDVRAAPQTERAELRRSGSTAKAMLAESGARELAGEAGFTPFERTVLRPALDVNGIAGGWQGPGVKSIIPASARAKLSCRLVPDQDPERIGLLLRRHVAAVAPPGVAAGLKVLGGSKPIVVDPRHPAVTAARRAARKAFGTEPVLVRSGGSVGAVELFARLLGLQTVLIGFALPDDGMHAPNERFHLPTFACGVETCARFLGELARVDVPRRLVAA